ncbi:hypothetical protein CDAR_480971 [Caerostris darwini]|uniref:Uncharacterized protein n=1 Tax=Caerostris darwini TaxID=1538125 RepID=A0AAV4W403_9ARAC|nr:hypothetical protein CDAR_480971 [Caerostris darwini]
MTPPPFESHAQTILLTVPDDNSANTTPSPLSFVDTLEKHSSELLGDMSGATRRKYERIGDDETGRKCPISNILHGMHPMIKISCADGTVVVLNCCSKKCCVGAWHGVECPDMEMVLCLSVI